MPQVDLARSEVARRTASGPLPGESVIVPAAKHGDREQILFPNPAEISAFIKEQC